MDLSLIIPSAIVVTLVLGATFLGIYLKRAYEDLTDKKVGQRPIYSFLSRKKPLFQMNQKAWNVWAIGMIIIVSLALSGLLFSSLIKVACVHRFFGVEC